MTELHPCPSCTELVTAGTCVCPHCGEKACRRGVHGSAAVLGLVLVAGGLSGCPGQSDYAAPYTGSIPTGDTAETTSQRHGPDLAEAIVDGRVGLHEAVEQARDRAREEGE